MLPSWVIDIGIVRYMYVTDCAVMAPMAVSYATDGIVINAIDGSVIYAIDGIVIYVTSGIVIYVTDDNFS